MYVYYLIENDFPKNSTFDNFKYFIENYGIDIKLTSVGSATSITVNKNGYKKTPASKIEIKCEINCFRKNPYYQVTQTELDSLLN